MPVYAPDDNFVVLGGMQDYNYDSTNCFELTLELGCDKCPPAKHMWMYWYQNKDSLLNFMKKVRFNPHQKIQIQADHISNFGHF